MIKLKITIFACTSVPIIAKTIAWKFSLTISYHAVISYRGKLGEGIIGKYRILNDHKFVQPFLN